MTFKVPPSPGQSVIWGTPHSTTPATFTWVLLGCICLPQAGGDWEGGAGLSSWGLGSAPEA